MCIFLKCDFIKTLHRFGIIAYRAAIVWYVHGYFWRKTSHFRAINVAVNLARFAFTVCANIFWPNFS